jgi:hypothetical protein
MNETMTIDYDINGFLSLRLSGPTDALASAAARQMDPLRPASRLGREPDVLVSHAEESAITGRGHRLGDSGDNQICFFDDDRISVSYGSTLVSVPFEKVGAGCEVLCTPDSGMRKLLIEYVRPALQLSLLPKNALAVHSAAASYNGKGILFAGWAESGKTESMLGFLQAGASFVSDKWTIVSGDGSGIHNFPTPITVRDWMIDLVPGLRGRLTRTGLVRARTAEVASSVLGSGGALRRVPGISQMKSLADLAGRVSVSHNQLFGNGANGQGGWTSATSAPFDALFFLLTSNSQEIQVRSAEPAEVAGRLADCARYERRSFYGLYQRFRYAFPGRRNDLVEESRDREGEMLTKALEGKAVYVVQAPFPFNPATMHEALRPFC